MHKRNSGPQLQVLRAFHTAQFSPYPAGKLNTGMASPRKESVNSPPWLRTELGDLALSLWGLGTVLRLLFGSHKVRELLVLGWRSWLLVAVRHSDWSEDSGVERVQGPRRLSRV